MLRCLLLALLCCFLYSCKKSKDKDPAPNDPVPVDTRLKDNLYIIDGITVRTPGRDYSTTTMKLNSYNPVSGALNFTGTNIPAIQEGDYIAGTAGAGYLRQVVSVVGYSNNNVTLNTRQAALEDVIEKGTIYLSMTPDAIQYNLGNRSIPYSTSVFINTQNGSSMLYRPTYTLKMQFENYKLQLVELRTAASGFTNNVDVRFTAEHDGDISKTGHSLVKYTKRFVAYAGKLPVIIDMDMDVLLSLAAKYNPPAKPVGQTVVFSCNGMAEAGLTYSSGSWSFTGTTERKFNYTPELCEIDGDLQASLTPRVSLNFYGVNGLSVSLKDTNWFDGAHNYDTRDWYMTWESFMQAGAGANPVILGSSVPAYNVMQEAPNTKHSGKAPFELKRISGYDVAGAFNGHKVTSTMQVLNYHGMPLHNVPVHFTMGNETGPSPGTAIFFPEIAMSVAGGNATTNWAFGTGDVWNAQAKIKKPDGSILYSVGLNAKK